MARIRHDLNTIYISGRLQESLRPVSRCALTAVVAPMGYGKTTAVNWFLAREAPLYPHQRLFRPPCHSLAKRAGGLCPRRVPVPA